MLYFIPAWYKQNNWSENEQVWYRRRLKSEFDETIKQITLFHRNVKVDYQIMNLAFSPNFRHFLHRQGMFRAPYWSLFDAISQVRRTKVAILSYEDIKWPSGVEFVYSPFAIVAYLKGEKYAKVEFGEDGNPITIDMFADGKISRKNFYDDRGFVASSIVYEDGKEQYQDFLMENGIWKIREHFTDGHVDINPNYPNYDMVSNEEIQEIKFQKQFYSSLEELIREVLHRFIQLTNEKDQFFVAAHALHIPVLTDSLRGKNMVLTFFENRYDYAKLEDIQDFMKQSRVIVTDSKNTSQLIRENSKMKGLSITDISPYDTRMDFGISQQLKVQNILVPVDGMEESELEKVIVKLSEYLLQNELARVHLFSRNATWGYENSLKELVVSALTRYGFDNRWAIPEDERMKDTNNIEINQDGEETKIPQRFFIDVCVDERTISKCINEQRVILDLRKTTDVFVFITAISKGVPRISLLKDQFLEHKENGYLINDYNEIKESISYYLDNMENWNSALVACYEIGKEYTTTHLIDSWRKVLELD